MDDLISRQAAIDSQIKMIAQGLDWVPVYHLEQLPSAERRGRWIPVTEELPAYGEDVLLSMNRDCSIGYLVPTYDERQYEWHHLGCFYFFNEVDAWMPLPEPYKEGEAE